RGPAARTLRALCAARGWPRRRSRTRARRGRSPLRPPRGVRARGAARGTSNPCSILPRSFLTRVQHSPPGACRARVAPREQESAMTFQRTAIRIAAVFAAAQTPIFAQAPRALSPELEALNPPVPEGLVLTEDRRVPAER